MAARGTLALVFTAAVAAFAQQPAPPPAAPTATAMLDRYATAGIAGMDRQFAALSPSAAHGLRAELFKNAGAWISAGGPDAPKRALIAASLIAEIEAARTETADWQDQLRDGVCGRCMMDRAADLVSRRPVADAAEHAWWRVAIAIGEARADRLYLIAPLNTPELVRMIDMTSRASKRFPNDPWFLLARGRTLAINVDRLYEMDTPIEGRPRALPLIEDLNLNLSVERKLQRTTAAGVFQGLRSNPNVGVEATVRLAYMQLLLNEPAKALESARAAEQTPGDPDFRYVAAVFAGQVHQMQGAISAAVDDYERALLIRPASQSATLALAALRFRDGRIDAADALVSRNFRERPRDDDPWRLYPYGDFARLPALLTSLREKIK